MKTTVEIADALLEAAKRRAHERGTTVRALIEAGLRRELEAGAGAGAFKLRDASFAGDGMRPEFVEGGWDAIRDALYEGRGA